MAGKFEIYKDKAGKFRYRLKAGNGEIILTGQGYASRSGLRNGIASIQKNSQIPERFEEMDSTKGRKRFVLRAANGQIIGQSEIYDSARSCTNGKKSVAKNAPTAKIVEA